MFIVVGQMSALGRKRTIGGGRLGDVYRAKDRCPVRAGHIRQGHSPSSCLSVPGDGGHTKVMTYIRRIQTHLTSQLRSEAWRRRAALWTGAVVVALAAILFSKASDAAFALFRRAIEHSPWWALLLTPGIFALLAWLTGGVLRPTRGSGIPQVIAALDKPDEAFRKTNLSPAVSAGKLLLTSLSLLGGASVGREGPTAHVGASLMYLFGRWFGFKDPRELSHFLLAGGAAGIAAAFNTPLAGIVFAIEELSGRFEHRFSGTLLTAVIGGGVVSLGILGELHLLRPCDSRPSVGTRVVGHPAVRGGGWSAGRGICPHGAGQCCRAPALAGQRAAAASGVAGSWLRAGSGCAGGVVRRWGLWHRL